MSSRLHLEIREVRIPYRFRYGHARKQHSGLEAVICIVRDDEGHAGFGEAVPRTYVTGETCASVRAAVARLVKLVRPDEELPAARQRRVELARTWQGPFPSCALCALDTALVDLRARREHRSVAEMVAATCPQTLWYTASIGIAGPARTAALLALYRLSGFRHLKIKVGDDRDLQRVRFVRRWLGSQASLFADANGAWDDETAIRRIEQLAKHNVWAVEEPLRARPAAVDRHGQADRLDVLDDDHFRRYRWLRDRSPLPLIADESLVCWQSAQRLIEHGSFQILNIRQSKCGGPLLSGALVDLARQHGLKFGLGAMVGETPILATAGAHFGAAHLDHLYIQGYSHTLLHGVRWVAGELKLRRGQLTVPTGTAGLGLKLHAAQLDAVTVGCDRVDL